MLVNQTLLYSVSNNTNNIRLKLCKNSFNAVWKKTAQRSPLSPILQNYVTRTEYVLKKYQDTLFFT